jgi:hypothetical protein
MTQTQPQPRTSVTSTETQNRIQLRALQAEHAHLLTQMTTRVEDLQTATAMGQWPAAELTALLDYFRTEVLQQAIDEEHRLFLTTSAARNRMKRDHARFRVAVEVLGYVGSREDRRSPTRVAFLARALLVQFEHHLRHEEATLVASRVVAETAPLAAAPRQ